MNLTKKMMLTLGLVAASAGFAQTATTASAPVGLLGQNYTEVNVGLTDIHNFSKNQYSAGIAANAPISANLDLTAGYDYSWLNDIGHSNSVYAGVTAYTNYAGVKPFVGGALGYTWDRFWNARDRHATWGVAAGVEIPVSVVTLTPRIVYSDDFRGEARSNEQWSYGVDANYWVTSKLAVFGAVDYVDVVDSSANAVAGTVGVRFKF